VNKFINKMAFSVALLAAVFVSSLAQAQTYSKSTANSNGDFNVRAGIINSGTAITDGKLFDIAADAMLVVSGSAIGNAVVTPVLADGSPAGISQTIGVHTVTPTIVSFTAPQPFTALRVSPSASLTGTNEVRVKIIQTKK